MAQERPDPTEIAGRYEVVEKLGAGAFGTVYKAKDRLLGRMVAIKTIRLDGLAAAGASLDELLARFKREAQVSAQLKHPNIVTIYDISETEGLSYLAMEFIDGPGLDKVIASSGRLSIERAAAIGAQIADALDYAHAHHVVHRDIKPANVMIETGDRVKVTDFGIAKAIDSGEHLTITGSLLGTPSYMSPEQARGGAVDGRSDLFSAGCILYEMVTGKKAFRGDSITALIFKIITEEPQPVGELEPSVPAPFTKVITKALAKDPETRYQTGRELASALLALISPTAVPTVRQLEVPTVKTQTPAPAATVVSAGTASPSQTARVSSVPTLASRPAAAVASERPPRPQTPPPPPARSRRSPLAVIAILAFLVVAAMAAVGVGAWFVFGRSAGEGTQTTDATAASPSPSPSENSADATPSPATEGSPAGTALGAQTGDASTTTSTPPLFTGGTQTVATPPPATPELADDFAFLERDIAEPSDDGMSAQRLADSYRSGGRRDSDYGSSGRFRRRRHNPPPQHPAELPAIRATRGLMWAEGRFKDRTGRYGQLSDLGAVYSRLHVAPGQHTFEHRGYRFDLRASADGYTIRATPLRSGLRAFVADSESDYIAIAEDD